MNKRGPIVIIEDDMDDQHVIELAFKELDYPNEVVLFTNAESALEYLEKEEVYPFLVLSDVNMPKINGFELRNRVMESARLVRKCIPYVFFSTSVSQEAVDEAFSKSVQGFFQKPVAYNELKDTLRSLVEYWKKCYSPSSYA